MRRVLYAAVAALVMGCAGDGPQSSGTSPTPGTTPTGDGVTIDQLEERIFTQNCLSGGCHNSADAAGALVLEPGQAWRELVGVIPDNPVAADAGFHRAVAADPANSFLLIKLGIPPGGMGARMPMSANPLSQADIDLVRQWIVDGARDRQGPSPTAQPSATPTATSSATNTPTSTSTAMPTETPTNTHTPTITATFTETPTGTVPPTSSPTQTATPSMTATVTATASASPSATAPIVSFDQIQETILTPSCATLNCHDQFFGSISGNLFLTSADVSYENLFEKPPDFLAAKQMGFLRVDPGDSANSFLYLKICDTVHGAELCPDLLPMRPATLGARMPFGKPPLPADQVRVIRDWILRGAPRTE